MLYDDKGSKLDSIYILAGDITLGEQLESDRYYILVEEEKKTTVIKGSMLQQTKGSLVKRLYRGSYMSSHVLLNLLKELSKRDNMRGLLSILSFYRNKFNKLIIQQEHEC